MKSGEIKTLNPATPSSNVIAGITKFAAPPDDELVAPFDVDGEFGTWVVTVSVLSGIVVPGMVVAGLVVPGATVLPPIKLGASVTPGIVVGLMVVPGIVVV